MTSVRSAPVRPGTRVELLGDAARSDLERLAAADPIASAVIASRLAALHSLEPASFGGALFGTRSGRHGARTGALTGAVFSGGNLIPIGGAEPDWAALAAHLLPRPRICTSIVGPAAAVTAMWAVLESGWGPARAVRQNQPLLVLRRSDLRPVAVHPRVRVMRPADLDRYLPAAAAMFTEELGISPFAGNTGPSYRRRVESLLATGRAFAIVDDDGEIVFKADVGALTAQTCQLQGVWVRPDLRGRGIGTAAVAAVLHRALRLAPTASLYVNDYNTAARRVYAKLGMRQVGSLSTVLF